MDTARNRVEMLVLGEVTARVDGVDLDLGHARQRAVLVALLVDAGRLVPTDRLLDRVWGDRPPQRARNALAGYLSRLRQVLAPADQVRIVRRPGGYLLQVDPTQVDLHLFGQLVRRARAAAAPARTGGTPAADDPVALLTRALSLWRGTPFGTLESAWLDTVRGALVADRLAAQLDLVDLRLAAGGHADLLGELTTLAAEHPLDERIAGQLMRALYGAGRQAQALRHYQVVRARLADELGTDPGAALRQTYHRILTADPALGTAAAPPAAPPAPRGAPEQVAGSKPAAGRGPAAEVPRQLPAAPTGFTGRAAALAALDAMVDDAAPLALVTGTAGVGKSSLVLHWAHRRVDRFPDGQLYVNLRGFDPAGAALDPAEVVRGFLAALGVAPQRMPIGLAAQTARYRSLVAGRRLLIVLDNARDADQVRPLLPGAPGCVTVVTSRGQLGGLVAVDGARPVALDLFTDAEARRLLATRLGRARVDAEPAAAQEIVDRCARLPLALAVASARVLVNPAVTLTDLAGELTEAGAGLDAFDGDDPAADVRAVFSWSYRALDPGAAGLFRLIGLHPGPELTVPAVASLAGVTVSAARRGLAVLTRASLLTEQAPGRYVLHDLLRAYAAELAEAQEPAARRRAATARLLDHLLHTAYAADRLLYPHRDPIMLDCPASGVVVPALADGAAAMRWLVAEHRVLLGAVDLAARDRWDRHAWELAWSLTSYVNLRALWHDQLTVQGAAVPSAVRLGDRAAQAHLHRNLGRALTQLDRTDEAAGHLTQALAGFVAVGDRANQAQTHVNIARLRERQGRDVEALDYDLRSLELYRQAGHLTGQARAMNNIAWTRIRLGEPEQARELCRQALAINTELGNRHGAATNWRTAGCAEAAAGEHRAAVDCHERALRLFRAIGDRGGEADTLADLGDARYACGEVDAARIAWAAALVLLEAAGHPDAAAVRARLTHHAAPVS
ncbi:BTAD domain-containing putative transcriptional regulator [Solwaraspora sp. WMMD791]|uniref:AfsR/SARP family transcriptional regulator n=1 Tax=Solwaraspora sp. WMMD791 TaxID=3016086 RepID=UPI00249C7BA0|nr:BTAD domain-containing putative transcriptional regulator [Solwaraspora sp. WMMD791]WFE29299.1 BTAD domain-containing putative transcriptional regulator [Solwaraspora sp. WMMD791]